MRSFIAQCCVAGITEWVVCPGARNTALLQTLSTCPGLTVWTHFDERSASFFALGRIQDTGLPVAVITTSGTAVAELYPAIVEAYYQARPLLLITADRPADFRGSGAPQAIEQAEMFGIYAPTVDIEKPEDISESLVEDTWDYRSPLHINICLPEPDLHPSARIEEFYPAPPPEIEYPRPALADLATALRTRGDRGMALLIGGLDPDEQDAVLWLARELKAPVLADATSGLREHLDELCLRDGDAVLRATPPPLVLRLGDVPVGRFWRDLEDLPGTDVFSITRTGFSGLARPSSVICGNIDAVIQALGDIDAASDGMNLLRESRKRESLIEEAINACETSEPALIRAISQYACLADSVFLGNSNAIRLWNAYAQHRIPTSNVRANRGANGIDGEVSTFLGNSACMKESWAVMGDLTVLYDANAPLLLPQLDPGRRILVVLNNRGGGIFRRLPGGNALSPAMERMLIQPQSVSFQHVASLWDAAYIRINSADEIGLLDELPETGFAIVELAPEHSQTEAFYRMLGR